MCLKAASTMAPPAGLSRAALVPANLAPFADGQPADRAADDRLMSCGPEHDLVPDLLISGG